MLGLKPADRRNRSTLARLVLCLAVAGIFGPVWAEGRRASARGETSQEAGGVFPAEMTGTGKARPHPQGQRIYLEPFYLIRKYQQRVQVERVIVTLDWENPGNRKNLDVRAEDVRAGLYQIFQQEMNDGETEAQVLELLRAKTGPGKLPAVTVRRSLMVLH